MGRQHCNLSIHERSRAANLLLRIRWSATWLICKSAYHITHSCTRKLPSSSCRANLFMNYVIDECERGSFNCHGMMNVVGIRPTEFGYRQGKVVGAYCNRWHGDQRAARSSIARRGDQRMTTISVMGDKCACPYSIMNREFCLDFVTVHPQ